MKTGTRLDRTEELLLLRNQTYNTRSWMNEQHSAALPMGTGPSCLLMILAEQSGQKTLSMLTFQNIAVRDSAKILPLR